MIGVFDSGFGGLTVLKDIVNHLPEYNYIYLGDSARAPYGNRSQELVFKFTCQATTHLFNQGCQLVILACNTASAKALRKLQQEWLLDNFPERRILGVIRPTVEEAVKGNKRVGVIATQGTVSSNAFKKEIRKIDSSIEVFQQACPLLVPIIEAGEQDWEGTDLILKKYLKPLLDKEIDSLILGCTHYPLIKKRIKKIAGEIKLISQDEIIGKKLIDYLNRHPELEKKLEKSSKQSFLTTDLTDNFQKLGSKFFGQKIDPRIIKLENS